MGEHCEPFEQVSEPEPHSAYVPMPDPATIAAALAEVATFLRSQKYAAYAIACDYAREAMGVLVALDDSGYRVAQAARPSQSRDEGASEPGRERP
jgi:hypothetical protein